MVVTSVLGHLMTLDFTPKYAKWGSVDPVKLFEAEICKFVPDVRFCFLS